MIPVATDMPPVYSALVFVPIGVGGPSRNQDGFAPQSAIFQKLADHVNHLKPLHVKGYINGKLVNNMLVDNGAMVNLMPYSLYKKLGGSDEELIKTKRMVKGVGGIYFGQGTCLDEAYYQEQNIGHHLLRCGGARELQFDSWARMDSRQSMRAF